NRGMAWHNKGDYRKAIEDYDEAIQIDPKNSLYYFSRGDAGAAKKQYDRAIRDFDEAIRLDPNRAYAYDSFAWLLATCPKQEFGDGRRAIELATKACDLTNWENGLHLATLAAAYAETGRFYQAVRWQKKALEDPAYVFNDEFRQRLELYEQKKPFRQ